MKQLTEAQKGFVEKYWGLAQSIRRRVLRKYNRPEDEESGYDAMLDGLFAAARNFNPERGPAANLVGLAVGPRVARWVRKPIREVSYGDYPPWEESEDQTFLAALTPGTKRFAEWVIGGGIPEEYSTDPLEIERYKEEIRANYVTRDGQSGDILPDSVREGA